MRSHFRVVLGSVGGVAVLMIAILGFHIGGEELLKFGVYSPLLGAFIGGILILVSTNTPFGRQEKVEPWLGREQVAWMLFGGGCIAWGIGECFWRYYVAQGQSPFPSLADFGYSSFAPLVFWGLLWQPFSRSSAHRHIFLLLDSVIAMGALLSIGWFLLLGPLAQTPAGSTLGKFLGIYYPTADIALLSYIIFLLLRGHDPIYQARGVAAYLRRFLPTSTAANAQEKQETEPIRPLSFGPAQAVPYFLLAVLFLVLAINLFSSDGTQQYIRPVLIIATLIVVGLVIVRQIVTIRDNERLMREQVATLEKLEQVYEDIAKRKAELEVGVTHLKEVQTRLANGDVRARASIMDGDLWPLANGLNLMADRMMRSEQRQRHAQKAIKAVGDLSLALERRNGRIPFVLPASCLDAPPELHHLLLVMGLKPASGTPPLQR